MSWSGPQRKKIRNLRLCQMKSLELNHNEVLYKSEDPKRVHKLSTDINLESTIVSKECVLIRNPERFIDLKISILGNANHGKSTLIGVLTSGQLDNGRESARNLICHLDHEKKFERTSSVGLYYLGFSQLDWIINAIVMGTDLQL